MTRSVISRRRRLLLPLLSLCLLVSCTPLLKEPVAGQSWPERPEATRIVWTGEVSKGSDIQTGAGFWRTMLRAITGEEEEGVMRPYGVHADCRKRILVADSQKRGLHLFDRELGSYHFIAGPGEAGFELPVGVTEDENNSAYLTDAAAGKVYRIHLGEKVPVLFAAGLRRPTGIVFNPVNKLLYVTETQAGQVVAFNRNGKEVLRLGRPGAGQGELNLPTDIAVDTAGRIYVTDPLNARVQIFSKEGSFVKAFGEAGDTPGYFGKAKGIAVNTEGHIYVCDALYDRIQVFNGDGRLLISFGKSGSGKGDFWMPSGIAIDKDDNIYIVDTYNKRIQLFGYIWLD